MLVEQTLNIFLREVLSKRYTNISSDIISLLTGLDNVDSIFTDFVASLDTYIRSGRTGTTFLEGSLRFAGERGSDKVQL